MAENNRVRQSKLGLGGKMYRLGLGSMSKDREGGKVSLRHITMIMIVTMHNRNDDNYYYS